MSELVVATLKWRELEALVPEEYIEKYSIKPQDMYKTICFSLLEEGQSIGALVLYPYRGSKSIYSLIYIAVDKEYSGKGIAKKLLTDTFDYIKKRNVKSVMCACFSDDEPFLSSLLKSVDFKKDSGSTVLVYGLDYTPISKTGVAIKRMISISSRVKSLYSLDTEKLQEFSHMMKKGRSLFNINSIDKEYSVVYEVDGEIIGYLEAEIFSENFVKTKDLYVKNSEKSKYAIPGMIAYLMSYSRKHLGQNCSLVLDLPKSSLGPAVINMFGEPDEMEDMVVLNKEIML